MKTSRRRCSPESDALLTPCKRRRTALISNSNNTGQAQTDSQAAIQAGTAVDEQAPLFDWLVVGLGNPGSTYDTTRHNVGFCVLDALARLEGISCRKLERSAAVGRGEILGRKVMLAKPVTFMNNSGESVTALSRAYRVPASRILVVSDDIDLPTAVVKLKPKGGHGGHNGLRSIIACLGESAFPRLKIGIGRPADQIPVPTYVLQDFSSDEQADIDAAISESVTIVKSVLALGLEKALSGLGFEEWAKNDCT